MAATFHPQIRPPVRARVPMLAAFLTLALAAGARASDVPTGAAAFQVPASSLSFLLQLGLLVVAARLGGRLFRRWNLSSTLGELIAGIGIGPHVLGGLFGPAFFGGNAGPAVENGLFGVAALGMMVLLFSIGLQTDARLLRRQSLVGIWVGVGGTLAALAGAIGAMVWLGPALLGRDQSWCSPETLFVAVAVAVTSIGLLARTLARHRRAESPEGRVALFGAAVDSLLAVFLLTTAAGVAIAVAAGHVASPLLVGQTMLKTAVTGLAAGALAWVGVRQSSRLARAEHDGIGPAVCGVCLALLAGGVFWFLDLSPLLGAYVLGVAFSTTEDRHAIQDRLEFVQATLVPACFALVGVAVDPGLLIQPGVLLFAGVFTGVVLLAKVAGCALPAWFAGLNVRGCLRVGLGMMPRGEIALAVALTALAAGVLSAELLAVVVALFLVAGVLAPLLTERAFARGGAGTRGGYSVPANQRSTFSFPSPNAARLVMNSLIELFEDEGFQVGLLHRRDALYQFTREDSVIGVQRIGSEIVFTCGLRERELAHTVMIEVVAGMEQNLRDLRKALDAGVLRRQMREEPSSPAASHAAAPLDAVLREALTVATMRPRLRAADKAGVIAELLDLLHENGLVSDLPAAAVAVFEREQSLSTGLGHGLALPHGRTDAVDRLVCAVGLKPEGVAFDGEDGKPARIVVLVLAPLRASAPQLRFISLISQKLNEEGRAALLASETPEEMLALLTGGGQAHAAQRRSALLASLAWQSISLDLRATGKEEALDQLVALCARSGAVTSPDEARQAVFAREGEYASVIEDGVALPHARTAAVERVVCAFGISRDGVSFDAAGGPRAHFLAMVLAPPGIASEYTRLVGILARALDAQGRQALLAAKSSQEALSILSARGEARDR